MPRPLPPGSSERRHPVPLRLSDDEERPVRELAETLPYVNGKPNISAAIRALIARGASYSAGSQGSIVTGGGT